MATCNLIFAEYVYYICCLGRTWTVQITCELRGMHATKHLLTLVRGISIFEAVPSGQMLPLHAWGVHEVRTVMLM